MSISILPNHSLLGAGTSAVVWAREAFVGRRAATARAATTRSAAEKKKLRDSALKFPPPAAYLGTKELLRSLRPSRPRN